MKEGTRLGLKNTCRRASQVRLVITFPTKEIDRAV